MKLDHSDSCVKATRPVEVSLLDQFSQYREIYTQSAGHHRRRRLLDFRMLRAIAAGILGFIVYGGWAFYVNSKHGVAVGLKAGFVQGTYSFALTLSTALFMEFLWTSLQNTRERYFLTLSITNSLTFATAYLVNWVFLTPEILPTIIPGFLIGIIYSAFYLFSLRKLNNLNHAD
jgi:hypothetical protein